MNELKPCPFCGGKPAQVHASHGWWLRCPNCQAEGPFDLGKSGAIEAWNTRPLEAQLLEACKAAVRLIYDRNIQDTSDYTLDILRSAIVAAEGD